MKREVGILVMFFSLIIGSAAAQKPAVVTSGKPGWHKIGETVASFKGQNESIAVMGADEFSSIKLKVSEAPVNIERLQVFYEEGSMEEISVDNELKPGEETRVIDLKHAGKDIQKIAFTYKTASNSEADKAHVEVYGLKSDNDDAAAYRSEQKVQDTRDEIREEARETGDEAEAITDEVRDDVNAETKETKQEVKEESQEAANKTDRKTDKAGKDIKRTAKKVGDKVSEGAGDLAANIRDKRVKGKVSPDGEAVYVDENSQYYYVNDKGAKVVIEESDLRDQSNN
ncbi:hypothetical protein [Chryseosolibacter indicus]|uniref:Uncharacterized protein n=1 Tax=Chryseosolibacter indicus TaxID=2782351 RepID=A0ABS5VXT7_9BACT|nr:hypothetical protein [Chryseosolibacter indicus]MBT1706227.1 hypothetical protein [Chryseosolibacter indicus]